MTISSDRYQTGRCWRSREMFVHHLWRRAMRDRMVARDDDTGLRVMP